MPDKKTFVDIILPLPLNNLFTYSIPVNIDTEVQTGKRVTVQFGSKKIYTGIIYKTHNTEPKAYKTKDIIAILDEKPIINHKQFEFWNWIAEYYMCTLGEVFKAALPSGLKLESESKILFNQHADPVSISEDEQIVLNILQDKGLLTVNEFHNLSPDKSRTSLLKSLHEKNLITILEKLKDNYKPKTVQLIEITKDYQSEKKINELLDKLEKAQKQLGIVMTFVQLSGIFGDRIKKVSKKELCEKANDKGSAVNALIKKGVFKIVEENISRLDGYDKEINAPNKLNEHQQKAYKSINNRFKDKDVILLHGITSSGKTEIYIHLINEQIKKGKQSLYLLPEIALTTQIINRLRKVFGNQIGIYHSKFSDAERLETWNQVQQKNGYKVVLGVRSSVFLPFDDLGLIIVDEEHENTYKQYDPAPRYNARDASIVLANIHSAKVLLGTATPALETYYNTQKSRYGLVELMHRYKDLQLPKIILADLSEARRKKQMKGHFTPTLLKQIDNALLNHEQIILFQNRRGFSPYLECSTCGWVPKCNQCDVSLTYHKRVNQLICHYCGYSTSVPKTCDACGVPDVKSMGFGTEKIEDDIKILFPNHKVARMDLDTTRSRKAYENIIYDFENHKIDILIGTQMVSKGLDFNNVSVVGILNADNMLHYPDFRSYERSFQLMSQVSGRAGRMYKQGTVVIQTSDVTNPIIKFTKNNNYELFFKNQLNERAEYRYPPFHRLIKITLKHKKQDVLNNAALQLVKNMRSSFGKRVLGPEEPIINRIQTYYLKQIILKIERDKSAQKAKEILKENTNNVIGNEQYKALQVIVDVDPM